MSTLHFAFNILEQLDHAHEEKQPEEYLSVPKFKTVNKPVKFNETKMNAHLARLEELREQFDTAEHDQSGKLPVGPAHCQFEDELKPCVWT